MSRSTPVDALSSGRPLRPPTCRPGDPNPNHLRVKFLREILWTPRTAAARSGRPRAAQAAQTLTILELNSYVKFCGRLEQRPPAQAARLRPRRPKP